MSIRALVMTLGVVVSTMAIGCGGTSSANMPVEVDMAGSGPTARVRVKVTIDGLGYDNGGNDLRIKYQFESFRVQLPGVSNLPDIAAYMEPWTTSIVEARAGAAEVSAIDAGGTVRAYKSVLYQLQALQVTDVDVAFTSSDF